MIHDLLRPEHPGINHNRIYRLYSEAGLAVRRKAKAKRYGERVPLVKAETVNQNWSLDFVSDSLEWEQARLRGCWMRRHSFVATRKQ